MRMSFTIVRHSHKRNRGNVLGHIFADSWTTATKKAARIQESKKDCGWKKEEWIILEENSSFNSQPELKRLTRRKFRRRFNKDELSTESVLRKYSSVGGYKIRQRNGTMNFD